MHDGVCTCSHDGSKHSWEEPTVCSIIGCKCIKFELASIYSPVVSRIDEYMKDFEKIIDKMKWVLQHWKWFRNYNNKSLVFEWWEYVNHWNRKTSLTDEMLKKLDEPETITRAKRYWVEKDHEKYGPFIPSVEEEKIFKQYSIEQFIVEHK